MGKYSLYADGKLNIKNYKDILNLYEYFEFLISKSSIKDSNFIIYASVKISDLDISDLEKDEFIREAFGVSNIKFSHMIMHCHDKNNTILFIGMNSKINVDSNEKILINEFLRLIEQNPINCLKEKRYNSKTEIAEMNTQTTTTNISPSNPIEQGFTYSNAKVQLAIGEEKKSWFEKYGFPLILAILGIAGAIIAALITIK